MATTRNPQCSGVGVQYGHQTPKGKFSNNILAISLSAWPAALRNAALRTLGANAFEEGGGGFVVGVLGSEFATEGPG